MQGLGIVPPLRGMRERGPPIPGPEPWATGLQPLRGEPRLAAPPGRIPACSPSGANPGLQPLRGESLIEYPNEDGRLRL